MAEQKKVFQLMDGRVIQYDPARPKLHPNIKELWCRVDPQGSGSLLLSMGTYYTFRHISKQNNGNPEPTHAEFVIRVTDAGTFLILALTTPSKPEAREFKLTNGEFRILRDINPQLDQAELQIDPDTLYTMDVFEADDPTYGRVVAANWSTAVATPRPEKSEGEGKKDEAKAADAKAKDAKTQAAATSQPAGTKPANNEPSTKTESTDKPESTEKQ